MLMHLHKQIENKSDYKDMIENFKRRNENRPNI